MVSSDACRSCWSLLTRVALSAGKGMHSRLYRRVLNQYEWVHNCTAFSSLYNDSGLVGIFISTDRARSGQSFDIITKELQVCLRTSVANGQGRTMKLPL